MHLGNARTALLNWLFARHHGGCFIIRLDDTDRKRQDACFTKFLFEDLDWLGLRSDEQVCQSERTAIYTPFLEKLKKAGRLYPCYETPEELERKRQLQLARRLPPVYDRASLHLSKAECHVYETQGRKPHWRFRLTEGTVSWIDLIRGPIQYAMSAVSDPIVLRSDGTPSFLLAGAIDDMDLGITHILRGEDHITNTAIQIQMMQALEGEPQALAFGHFSLITDTEGRGFSKRLGSISLQELRQEGLMPLAITSTLAALGTADAPQMVPTLIDLARHFDLKKFGRSTPKLDLEHLRSINRKYLQQLPWEQARSLLKAQKCDEGITQTLWEIVRSDLKNIQDVQVWKNILLNPLIPPLGVDPGFCVAASEALPSAPWDQDTWKEWTLKIKKRTGLSGRALYHPLRLLLTGRDQGPEMRFLLPLIGFERSSQRLKDAMSR